MERSLLEGNEAVAWGAYHAGCRFFAGYPITPATSIFNTMLNILPPKGGIVLQAEDEIAAMGYCIGASMAGLKVMTATSGPGISLYSEQISFAIGSEIPMVIVDVQRLDPRPDQLHAGRTETCSSCAGATREVCRLSCWPPWMFGIVSRSPSTPSIWRNSIDALCLWLPTRKSA